MLFKDLFEETYFSLSANKSRSILTILGIVIGIASVITMISIGQGAAQNIQNNIESLGSNLLMVMPGSQRNVNSQVRGGFGSATTLVLSDAEAIEEKISGIENLAPTISTRKQIKTTSGTNTNTSIYGVKANYAEIKNITVSSGIFINDNHNQKLAKVAVIGPTTKEDLFGDEDALNKKIRIDNIEFTVIGVTTSKGGSGMNNADDLIYAPLSTVQKYISGSEALSNINIQVAEADKMSLVQQEVTNLLLTRHKIADANSADFSVINQAEILDTATSVTDTLTLLLGAIAGISLLVGGIGIMNMMLTIVTERTKEIGLRKSLGAKNNDISLQFLAESISLTFIGGVIGIIVGYLAAWLVTKFSGTNTAISLMSVILAVGVSGFIGIVFGYYPARRAAKMDPITALRYE